jgi:hypothetical protein
VHGSTQSQLAIVLDLRPDDLAATELLLVVAQSLHLRVGAEPLSMVILYHKFSPLSTTNL